jgi:hypothetical protein
VIHIGRRQTCVLIKRARYHDAVHWFQMGLQVFTGHKDDTKNANILRRKLAIACTYVMNQLKASVLKYIQSD